MTLKGETIATGAAATCEDCGVKPPLEVHRSAAGYYIGTYCNCGPYSRESGYYDSHDDAVAAFKAGGFERSTEYQRAGHL